MNRSQNNFVFPFLGNTRPWVQLDEVLYYVVQASITVVYRTIHCARCCHRMGPTISDSYKQCNILSVVVCVHRTSRPMTKCCSEIGQTKHGVPSPSTSGRSVGSTREQHGADDKIMVMIVPSGFWWNQRQIDVCGKRLAAEVGSLFSKRSDLDQVRSISFIGYSAGGLFVRWGTRRIDPRVRINRLIACPVDWSPSTLLFYVMQYTWVRYNTAR